MPFVKKNDSQGSQPPIDVYQTFIGRTGELLFFVQNILKPEDPTHNILSISGQGGVGKSTLLDRFIAEAHKAPFKGYCLTASVDERQVTLISMMEKLAQQLHLTGKFEKALKQYKEAIQKRQIERETLRDRLFERVPDVAGAIVEGIPVAGPLLREGAKIATVHLLQEYQVSQGRQDAQLLETSIDDLTIAFVTELNHLADTNVTLSSTGQKRQRRIVLFFDTFEQLASEVTPWLLDHFLAARVSSNVVLVVAGRDAIEQTSPNDPKRWLPYCDDGTIYWISLNSFTEDETRMYLVKRGITDPEKMATIWQLSRGLPLYLGLLTSNPQGYIDPTKDVVVNFLRWIPEQQPIKRKLALDAALLSRSFNQDDLEAFSYILESDRLLLYQWLIEQPFVRSKSQDGRYLYHDVARKLFSRHLYQISRKRYYTIRREIATYYQDLLQIILMERGKEGYRLEDGFELLLAIVSQLLLLPDRICHIKAVEHILYTFDGSSREQDKEIARVLQAASQDLSADKMRSGAQQVATHLLRYVTSAPYAQEKLDAVNALLEQVTHEPSFPTELTAKLYRRRAVINRNLRDWQHADEDFQHVIDLTGTSSSEECTERGWAHYYRREYQQALTELTSAIELNPSNAEAYRGRSRTYESLNKHQQAVEDLERALKLSPNVVGAGKLWNLGEHQKAGEILQHLLDLADASSAEGHTERGWAYFYWRKYQQALAEFTQAIKHDPDNALAYKGRGWTYLNLGEDQRAIEDLEHTLKLEPNFPYVYNALETV